MPSPFSRSCITAALCMLLSPAALAQLVIPENASQNLADGAMGLGCTALDVAGTLNMDTGAISGISAVIIAATGTVNGDQGSLSVSGDWNNSGTFVPGTGTVMLTDGCALGPIEITGTTVFNNLTLTSTDGRTFIIPAGENLTVNGVLTLQGAEGQPIELVSSSGVTALISLGPSAQLIQSFANVNANVQIGALQIDSSMRPIPTMSAYGLSLLALLIAAAALRGGRSGGFNTMRKN